MKKINKKIAIACCGLLCGLGIAVPFASQRVQATAYVFEQVGQFQTDIKKGDTIKIPDGRFGSVDAMHYVYCPNGEVYTTDTVTLLQHGEYTVKYVAEISDKTYVEERTFEVANPLTYFVNDKGDSNVEYGYSDITRKTGLKVAIENGAEFVYNQVIDLNKTSQSDPAVWLTYIPIKDVGFGANRIIFTFTDVYDPSNKVEVRLIQGASASNPFGHVTARAPGQLWAGYYKESTSPQVYINQTNKGSINRSCPFDTASGSNFIYEDMYATQYYKLWFDLEENKVYGTYRLPENKHPKYARAGEERPAAMIIDFDDASYQTVLWDGFTTGEVYLSITCEEYNQSTNEIQLLSINGSDLTANKVAESIPSIEVDMGNLNEDELPSGTVGCSYPVLEATAYDKNCGGKNPVNARVFFGYSKLSGTYENETGEYIREIPIQNGRFDTPYVGDYAISYTYKTYTGKTYERVVVVHVTETALDLEDVVVGEADTAAEPYERVRLADVLSYGGGVGSLHVARKVTLGEEIIPLQESKALGYSFQPQKAGVYTVTYTVTDMVGNTSEHVYTVNVVEQSAPVFTEKPTLPKYFFDGVEYVLPTLTAMDASENEEVMASVKIMDGLGERDYTQGSKVTLKANEDGNAVIRYFVEGRSVDYPVPVLTVKQTNQNGQTDIVLKNYYVSSTNVEVSDDSKGSKFSVSGSGDVEFARNLLTDQVELLLNMGSMGKTFDRFTLTLTDSYDPTITIKMDIIHRKGILYLGMNGGGETEYKALPEEEFQETIKYDAAYKAFRVGSNEFLRFTETVYGDPFNGFTSGSVYIGFSFEEVREESYIYLNKINNQPMNATRDNITPMLYVDGIYEDTVKTVGDTFTLLNARAIDVLSPITELTVTVTYNNMYVTSTTGVTLGNAVLTSDSEYAFKLTEYGDYTITYLATDWSGRTYRKAYSVKSVDVEAPIIQVAGMPKSISIGQVALPNATVTDNVSAADDICVWTIVRMPSGEIVMVEKGEFTANEKGVYTITYYAMDEVGNIATVVYSYTV